MGTHSELGPNRSWKARMGWNALRLGLGLFFLIAAGYKLSHQADFWGSVRELWPLHTLPVFMRLALIGMVIALEFLCGGALLLGRGTRQGALLALCLLLLFTVLVGPQFRSCACTLKLRYFVPESLVGFLVRNTVLSLAALALWLRYRRPPAAHSPAAL